MYIFFDMQGNLYDLYLDERYDEDINTIKEDDKLKPKQKKDRVEDEYK